MKSIIAQLTQFLQKGTSRRNLKVLLRLLAVLAVLVAIYSVIFHFLMLREGREYSWFTGIYWTLTVMSTLGFGDITFTRDLGLAFSMCVLLTGTVFMLILLPFTFIQFFYAPWMAAQSEARAPRRLPAETSDHILLTHYDPVTSTLINKLTRYHYPYFLLVPDVEEALRLHDLGLKVVVGDLDNPETYRKLQIEQAALVATTASDAVNTHVVFTVRELAENVPIIATVDDPASADILELAGSSRVLQLSEMLGQSLARRSHGNDAMAHVIGQYDQLLIAETTVAGTPMVGKTLQEIGLRSRLGITVLGVWEHGLFETARQETPVGPSTVLLLAGSREQLEKYNELYCIYRIPEAPVVVLGGGRVGRATIRALIERGLDYRVVEQKPEKIQDPEKFILGNAAELEVLKEAGIMEAPTVIITTHDDDINVYLTIYCHRLRPDIQIISRVSFERNIHTLHRAGADFVISYASMGANAIFNLLERGDTLMVAEGLDVFKIKTPPSLVGKTIAESAIRSNTGCMVVALESNHAMEINPDPNQSLPADAEIILIGSVEAENRFLDMYVTD
jgi:Trk K+ transport system NAD-binding subunit